MPWLEIIRQHPKNDAKLEGSFQGVFYDEQRFLGEN